MRQSRNHNNATTTAEGDSMEDIERKGHDYAYPLKRFVYLFISVILHSLKLLVR